MTDASMPCERNEMKMMFSKTTKIDPEIVRILFKYFM